MRKILVYNLLQSIKVSNFNATEEYTNIYFLSSRWRNKQKNIEYCDEKYVCNSFIVTTKDKTLIDEIYKIIPLNDIRVNGVFDIIHDDNNIYSDCVFNFSNEYHTENPLYATVPIHTDTYSPYLIITHDKNFFCIFCDEKEYKHILWLVDNIRYLQVEAKKFICEYSKSSKITTIGIIFTALSFIHAFISTMINYLFCK